MALLPLPLLLYLLSLSCSCYWVQIAHFMLAPIRDWITPCGWYRPLLEALSDNTKNRSAGKEEGGGEGERSRRGSCVRVSTRLSRLQNFIGDYHNVACPWPGSIVVLSPFWALSAFAARICARRGVDFRGSLPETKVQMQIQIPVADLGFSLCYARCRCRLRRRDG